MQSQLDIADDWYVLMITVIYTVIITHNKILTPPSPSLSPTKFRTSEYCQIRSMIAMIKARKYVDLLSLVCLSAIECIQGVSISYDKLHWS